MQKETRDPICYVTVPVYACMHAPEPADPNGAQKIGHMHIQVASATLRYGDKVVGEVGADPACTLVLKVNGKNYHINAQPVWEALEAELAKVGVPQ